MTYVQGRNVWHILSSIDGGIRTRCGRVLPLTTRGSYQVAEVFVCELCRKSDKTRPKGLTQD